MPAADPAGKRGPKASPAKRAPTQAAKLDQIQETLDRLVEQARITNGRVSRHDETLYGPTDPRYGGGPGLVARVEIVDDTNRALAGLPARVAEMRDEVTAMYDAFRARRTIMLSAKGVVGMLAMLVGIVGTTVAVVLSLT